MRILSVSLLAVALLAAVASPARAQTGLRGPGGAIGGFHLIAMPAVQQELQLNEGQVAKAKRAVTLAGPHYEEGMRELRSFLAPPQVDRFDQILFQQRGPIAMLEPKIAQTLQITNEQAQKVAELFAQARNEQRAAVQAAGKDQGAAVVKVESIAADANIKAAGLLSPEQRRTWTRLTGEPFRPDLAGGAKPADDATPKR